MPKINMEVESSNCSEKSVSETDCCFRKVTACQSAAELLSMSDLRQVVNMAFNKEKVNEIRCPNKGCNETFSKANAFLLHLKRCRETKQATYKNTEKAKKRLLGTSYLRNYHDFQKKPDKWACLDGKQQLELIKAGIEEHEGKPIACLNKNCSQSLNVPELLAKHINECFLPEYFRYMDNSVGFRSLEKQEKARILRDALKSCSLLPCLNYHCLQCKYFAKNSRSLSYHLERCGVNPKERPWKCYRCGFESKSSEGSAHLIECRLNETTQLLHSAEAEQNRLLNLENDITANETVKEMESSDNHDDNKQGRKRKSDLILPLSTNLNYVKSHRLNDANVSLTSRKVARITSSGKHQRFKFNNSNLNANYPPPVYQKLYAEAIRQAREQFDHKEIDVPLCSTLSNAIYEKWSSLPKEQLTTSAKKIFDKSSISFVIRGQSGMRKTSSGPISSSNDNSGFVSAKKQLPAFSFQDFSVASNKKDNVNEKEDSALNKYSGCFTYCGGPISTISFCPRLLESGKEFVAVTVFTDEEYLISKDSDLYESKDYLQLFFLEHIDNNVNAYLGCIVETEVGTILTSVWCPVLRNEMKFDAMNNFFGFLAVAGTQGNIGVYLFHTDFLSKIEKSDGEANFFHAKPAFELIQKDEPSVPIIALSWSIFEGGAKIASVTASGFVHIWNLNNITEVPLSIPPTIGAMSPFAVSFFSMHNVAITYREKVLRVFNTESKEVYTCPRVFSGLFCYQGDNITTSNSVFSPCCYITLGDLEQNIFVVPMPNRHEVVMWDLSVCPYSGSLLTVGGDGNLNLSLSGRLLPHFAEKELNFCASRTLMNLHRKFNMRDIDDNKSGIISSDKKIAGNDSTLRFPDSEDSDGNKDTKAPRIPATDLKTGIEQFYLEISFNESPSYKESLTYSLDIRFESLNRIAISEAKGYIAVCGGEAGLLFFVPF